MPHGLPQKSVDRICSVFSKYPQVEEVVLYGSRAKGSYKAGSDIDLTLKGAPLDMKVLNRIDADLDDLLLPWTFDLSIYSQIENEALVDHINRVGAVFFSARERSMNDLSKFRMRTVLERLRIPHLKRTVEI